MPYCSQENNLRMVALFFWNSDISPADARKETKKSRKKRKRYNTIWTDDTYSLLKSIVDDKGDLY